MRRVNGHDIGPGLQAALADLKKRKGLPTEADRPYLPAVEITPIRLHDGQLDLDGNELALKARRSGR